MCIIFLFLVCFLTCRCVMKMDHHCPWINTCCGHLNHANFVYFLFFAPCGCIHGFIILVCSVYRALNWVCIATNKCKFFEFYNLQIFLAQFNYLVIFCCRIKLDDFCHRIQQYLANNKRFLLQNQQYLAHIQRFLLQISIRCLKAFSIFLLFQHYYYYYTDEPVVFLGVALFIGAMFAIGLSVGVVIAVGALFVVQVQCGVCNAKFF